MHRNSSLQFTFTSEKDTDFATTTYTYEDQEDAPNPFNPKYNLKVTPWIIFPSYICLITMSAVLLFLIFKHLRFLLEIYLSVIAYLASQLLLLLTLTGSWIVELLHPGESQKR